MVLHVHVLPESVAKKIGTYHNLHWHFFLHISNLKLESDFFYTEYTAPYMKEMGFLGDFFYENLRVYCPGTWILLWTCSFPRCVIDLKKNTVFFSVHTGRAVEFLKEWRWCTTHDTTYLWVLESLMVLGLWCFLWCISTCTTSNVLPTVHHLSQMLQCTFFFKNSLLRPVQVYSGFSP